MPILKPDEGFVKADGRNLPVVDDQMLQDFFQSPQFLQPELRNVKARRSARPTYGDNAVGYVQLKREGTLCRVMALITPEHNIRAKGYRVSVVVQEKEEEGEVQKASCEDCAASADCCKHAVAFVTWLYRRSAEVSPTSVLCYWQKFKLSKVGTALKFVRMETIAPPRAGAPSLNNEDEFFNEAMKMLEMNAASIALIKSQLSPSYGYSIYHLLLSFRRQNESENPDAFLAFCKKTMKQEHCVELCKSTQEQAESTEWFALSSGRISASKFYEASKCQTPDGSLVNSILGVTKIKDNAAMERGRALEAAVIKVVSKQLETKINRCGFAMKSELIIFGASPDGVTTNDIIEVKCPVSEKSFKTYFSSDSEPSQKCKAQMLLQMLLCDKQSGYFCVAHPDFETSEKVTILYVKMDVMCLINLMQEAKKFWVNCFFPALVKNL